MYQSLVSSHVQGLAIAVIGGKDRKSGPSRRLTVGEEQPLASRYMHLRRLERQRLPRPFFEVIQL